MSFCSRPISASTCETFGARCTSKWKDFSMNPKFSIYQADGYGRDSYIKVPNGGFRKSWNNNYRTYYWNRNSSCENVKATRLNPKFAIYKSNGFGRDSYIFKSCGGFFKHDPIYNGNNTSITHFVSNLRNSEYERFRPLKAPKNDFHKYCQGFKSPKEIMENRMKVKHQRTMSARLARPKI